MIDVVRAVSAAASIETPTTIDLADAQHLSMRTPASFGVGDLFAGVFSDLASSFEG